MYRQPELPDEDLSFTDRLAIFLFSGLAGYLSGLVIGFAAALTLAGTASDGAGMAALTIYMPVGLGLFFAVHGMLLPGRTADYFGALWRLLLRMLRWFNGP